MKFELDDQTVLRLSGLTCCAYGLYNYIAPEHSNTVRYEKETPTSVPTTRGMGMVTTNAGAIILSVTGDNDLSVDGRKKLLKANAGAWGALAAQTLYNTEKGINKKDYGYANAAAMAVLSGLCLWRGFKDEDAKEED